MKARIDAEGRIVVPEELLRRVNLQAGDEVRVEARDGDIFIVACREESRLGAHFAGSGMAQRLLEDRAAEPQ